MGSWYPFSLQMMADIICKVHVFVHCSIADYLKRFFFFSESQKVRIIIRTGWTKNNKYKNELVSGITIVVHRNLLKFHNLLYRQCQTKTFFTVHKFRTCFLWLCGLKYTETPAVLCGLKILNGYLSKFRSLMVKSLWVWSKMRE